MSGSASSSIGDQPLASRRRWLQQAGGGSGLIAAAGLLADEQSLATERPTAANPLSVAPTHFAAKAKRVIWLFMEGAPSAVDMFDPKPELTRNHGKRTDIKVFFGNPGPLMKSPFRFQRYGECGQPVSEHYSNVAQRVDDMAFIKSCYSESDNHVPAIYQINSGLPRAGFPTAGAWVTYALRSENQNLQGYVVLGNTAGAKGGPHNWGSGFLPAAYQGTLFRSQGNPVLNLKRLPQVSRQNQRAQLDLMGQLNRLHLQDNPGEVEFQARVQSFELAWRMQSEALNTVDVGQETQATRQLYGVDQKHSRSYGTKCLMARRLIERGVRFV